jgi:hypothetical protein
LVPLGQVRDIVVALGAMIPGVVATAMATVDDDPSTFAPDRRERAARNAIHEVVSLVTAGDPAADTN